MIFTMFLNLISTIAQVTSAVLQWIDFSSNPQKATKNREHHEYRDAPEISQAKVEAVLSELKRSQNNIANAFIIVGAICIIGPLWLADYVEFISPPIPDWLLSMVAFLVLVVISFGVMMGASRFLIQRKIDFYSFDVETLSQLKIAIGNTNWEKNHIRWFIQEAFLQINPSQTGKR